jgi:antitoxin (DNA-binding transcriptional repressor) of toxin-antitoxin stability system
MDTAKVAKVGMRQFRHEFGEWVDAGKPLAITKHGRTVGLYIPVRQRPAAAQLTALEEAGRVLDALMAQKGITEEQAVEEFKRLRRDKKRRG